MRKRSFALRGELRIIYENEYTTGEQNAAFTGGEALRGRAGYRAFASSSAKGLCGPLPPVRLLLFFPRRGGRSTGGVTGAVVVGALAAGGLVAVGLA